MCYKYYVICLVFLLALGDILFAQQLRLPDEDIVGNVSVTPDSLSISKDLSEFHLFDHTERLVYKPILQRDLFSDRSRQQNGYLYMRANSYPLGDIRFGMWSNDVPEINFHLRGYYDNLAKGFSTRKIGVDWLPLTTYTDWRLQPSASLKLDKYKSNLFIGKADVMYGEMALVATPKHIAPLNRVRLSANYFRGVYYWGESFKSDPLPPNYDSSQSDFELDFNVNLSKISFLKEIDLNMYRYFDNFHTNNYMYISDSMLDLFALNLQYSETVIPSIVVEKSIPLDESVDLSFSNRPYIEIRSLYDFHEEFAFDLNNSWSGYGEIKYASQIPLNLFLTFTLYDPIEAQLYLNSQYIKNHYHIGLIEATTIQEFFPCYSFPLWLRDTAWKHSINLDMGKRVNNFAFGLDSKYQYTKLVELDMKIPYEAHLQFSPHVGYSYKKFSSELKGTTHFLRYGIKEYRNSGMYIYDKLPQEPFILSSSNSYDITRNFKVSLNLNNIFNQKYYKIKGLPEDKFNAEMMFRVLF